MKPASEMGKDEIEEFIKDKNNSFADRKRVAEERLSILGDNNLNFDQHDKIESQMLIKSGLVNDKLSEFISSDKSHVPQKKDVIINSIKELSLN